MDNENENGWGREKERNQEMKAKSKKDHNRVRIGWVKQTWDLRIEGTWWQTWYWPLGPGLETPALQGWAMCLRNLENSKGYSGEGQGCPSLPLTPRAQSPLPTPENSTFSFHSHRRPSWFHLLGANSPSLKETSCKNPRQNPKSLN